jgi:membrane-associated phospholipid phosphatase
MRALGANPLRTRFQLRSRPGGDTAHSLHHLNDRGFAMPSRPASLKLKLVAGIGATALNAVVYLFANHFPLRAPRELPWTALDAAVPFVPATVWVYVTDYVLVASAFLFCRTEDDVRRFARAFAAMLLTGCAVHLVWPTTFPRDRFPLEGAGFTTLAFGFLRSIDLPTSCLPSMHVAGSYLAALSLWRRSGLLFTLWTLWATAVAVSTLTAKQHYAIDVFTGLAMAVTFWLLFFVLSRRHPG